ncbi:hypothetical protein HMPREF9318_01294 [Streptococcus urinalis FB127-CNA-2]|uniref:Pyridine nucleotide-disulfide oxidoreductase n=1 Tax=Streptococcus urinalis 2285-97 TaxID=764291 RepID=G5KCM3_9STRE|nr:FAD-dependent oxidoreductase [Streptococcus urinalis]EHJ57456.1 pyridine nucleotide-disulfide oxidoreductase [Streptococcus urinalis 2285-97]EKS19772.1 hypothetical protein HMPREF9318_01294 [Streptococcus urinalis FB127-CNA-2]VEF31349.1 pyridine nucleotide-disulfide oxidoreductase [Streptococcus urinalis]
MDRLDYRQFDSAMLNPLEAAIAETSVTLIRNERVEEIKECQSGIRAITKSQRIIEADVVLLAVNFRPNSHLLDGICEKHSDLTIKVNQNMQTSQSTIYAIGDLVSCPMFSLDENYYAPLINHVIRTGQKVAYHFLGVKTPPLRTTKVMGSHHFGFYRSSIGLTEEEASLYQDTISYVYRNLEKGNIFCLKLIASKKEGKLLRAQILSKETNLMLANQLSQAISYSLTDQDLAFQDFIYSKGNADMADYLHKASLKLFEKRHGLC